MQSSLGYTPQHVDRAQFKLSGFGQEFVLDLTLNHRLMTESFAVLMDGDDGIKSTS